MKTTIKHNLIIFHRPTEWDELQQQLITEYGKSIVLVRDKCRRELGFTPRHHKGLVPYLEKYGLEVLSGGVELDGELAQKFIKDNKHKMAYAKNIFDAKKGLVVFDMDSTLITAEVIDEMAIRHGVGDQVKLITARAMNGGLRFDQSLTERVALLKGFNRKHMEDILDKLVMTPGTPEFLKILNELGIKTAIASGGFQYFAKSVQEKLKIDYAFANDLEFEGELLTGKILMPIVNAEAKEKIIMDLAAKENLSLTQVVAIGDGANDIPMLLKAGLGIAIHAKEKVQKTANYRINFGPMTSALSFMNNEAL